MGVPGFSILGADLEGNSADPPTPIEMRSESSRSRRRFALRSDSTATLASRLGLVDGVIYHLEGQPSLDKLRDGVERASRSSLVTTNSITQVFSRRVVA